MRQIFRYEVPVDGRDHEIALCADPLAVGCRQPDVVEFWGIHDWDASVTRRSFRVIGTGHPLPDGPIRYWGAASSHPSVVWHLIETTPPALASAPTEVARSSFVP